MGRFSLEVVADVIAGRMNVGKRRLIAFSAPSVPGGLQFGTLRAVVSSYFHGNFEASAILALPIFSLKRRRYYPALSVTEAAKEAGSQACRSRHNIGVIRNER